MTTTRPAPSASAQRDELVRRACRSIASAEEPPRLADLARQAGLSRFHFQRVFKQVMGLSPGDYYTAQRARRLETSLAAQVAVDSAIYEAGFGSPSRVYERSDRLLGMTPALYRRGAPGMRIRYAVARTELGPLLVAATDRGICAAEFGASRAALETMLLARFHAARIDGADPELERWLARIVAFIQHPAQQPDVPLDLAGTSFQLRVWKALRAIPPGETLSYTQLAARMGMPRAVRAVAGACARNPAAVAVPCHRAIGSDGSLRGYRWGLERKAALLKKEHDSASESRSRESPRRRKTALP